jgi:hypothetical protein
MTIAASVVCGMRPMSGARTSIVSSATAAVTIEATCERAPACLLTAVCEVPPPEAMAPSSAPPAFAIPVASSSRLGRSGGSPRAANARAAAIDSVKLMSAHPSAPGQSSSTSERSGSTSDGHPRGIVPTVSTPRASRPSNAIAATPTATATSGAGSFGRKRSSAISKSNVATPSTNAGQSRCGTASTSATTLWKNPPFGKWTPSSFGI